MATDVMRPQTAGNRPPGLAAGAGLMHTFAAASGALQMKLTAGGASLGGGPALEQLKRSAGASGGAEHAKHGPLASCLLGLSPLLTPQRFSMMHNATTCYLHVSSI